MENISKSLFSSPRAKQNQIRQIQRKIQQISQHKAYHLKEKKHTNTADRISQLQLQFSQDHKNAQHKIRNIREKIRQLQMKFEENDARTNLELNNRSNQIKQVHYILQKLIDDMLQKSKESEKKLIAGFSEKIDRLYSMLARQIEKRHLLFNKLDNNLLTHIPETNSAIKEEFYQTFLKLKEMEDRINKEIECVIEKVSEAKKKQEEGFEQFLSMVASIIEESKEEIAVEKQNRLKCKDKLINLFEDAYAQLTNA